MRNVIGIDPAFYEYIFMVDANTVRDNLSVRLVLVLNGDLFWVECYSELLTSLGCMHRR